MFKNLFKNLFTRSASQSDPCEKVKVKTPSWYNADVLNTTFNELQSAVKETSALASSISSQLENKLRVTQQQLHTILYVMTEGIVITDHNNIIQEWNTGAEIIFGYSKEEALGQNINIIVADANTLQIAQKFDKLNLTENGNINKIKPITCKRKDGSEVLVEMSINSFSDGTDTPPGTIAIMRDVTVAQREIKAREQERKLMVAVLNSISDVVMVKDGGGKWVLANKAAHDLYSFTSERDYVGKTNMELAEDFPYFTESFAECETTDEQAWKLRRTTRTEEVVIDKNEQRQYFDVLKTPIYSDAKHRDILVVAARNITSLREKREHILAAHKALNAASDIIAIADRMGTIIFANKMFMIKYRFADIRDVIGQKMSIIKSDRTTSDVHEQMWKVMLTGKSWEGVIVNCDAMGRDITVDSSILPIVDDRLEVSYFICIQRCIDC